MRLTVLGSGNAFSGHGNNACYALDGRVLIDCGSPAHHLLARSGHRPGDLDLILLTHFHADHCFQLPMLLGARALNVAEPRPLTIAGPHGTREYVRRMIDVGYGTHLRRLIGERLPLAWAGLQDGSDVTVAGYRVRAHSVVHSLGPSLAYAVTGPDGATVGFSGDSTFNRGLRATAAESDLMVCECTGWDRPIPSHMCAREVGQLIAGVREGGGRARFLLSHLSETRRLDGALVAHDLLSIDVPPPGARRPRPPASVRRQRAAAGVAGSQAPR